ncbi:MAG: cytidine deaminase [Planctomycetes bacterium SM23_32]|nr:MAG: cytidine deaminase [Planctomycetes bacterium SM23_32]
MADGEERRRPSWDEYFMRIAHEVAKRSTCLRRSVGALVVLDKRILATGYNGAPSGLPHCSETGCLREQLNVPSGERHELCRGLHAEMNALLQGARHGIRMDGGTLYSTLVPCSLCCKMAINTGIKRVVAAVNYPDGLGRDMLLRAGVDLVVVPVEEGRAATALLPDETVDEEPA